MKFSIITPTYKRASLLLRAIDSAIKQSHIKWEMIVVNDSPEDSEYELARMAISDPRIRYFSNTKNRGVNFSRNFALDNIASDSEWIVFLDDDDYLEPNALENLSSLIDSFPQKKWFVTNRAYADGKLVTKYPRPNAEYSYINDVLIFKRCKGDVTHCIQKDLIGKIKYSKHIKQAEEWIFYYQLALKERMYYANQNSTLTDGYDSISGLNFRKRTFLSQITTVILFVKEGWELNLLHYPTFITYATMRLMRAFLKK